MNIIVILSIETVEIQSRLRGRLLKPMKFKKSESLLRAAINHSIKISDIERQKELGKKGAQYLVDYFLGTAQRKPLTLDYQKDIEQFYEYVRRVMANQRSTKRRRLDNTALEIIERLFPTQPLMPGPPHSQQGPDIDDRNVVSAQELHYVELFLDKYAVIYDIEPALVLAESSTESSGHESV